MQSRIQWSGKLMHLEMSERKLHSIFNVPWIMSRISVGENWVKDAWWKKEQTYGNGKGWSYAGKKYSGLTEVQSA